MKFCSRGYRAHLSFALFLTIAVLAPCWAARAHAQVKISLIGYGGSVVSTFERCSNFVLTLNVNSFFGPLFQDSPWKFGVISGDTNPACCATCDYRMTVSFRRPEVDACELVIGGLTRADQNARLEGLEWRAPDCYGGVTVWEPTDFTHLGVEFYPAGADCPELFMIPIHWTAGPVPVEGNTWGHIKGLYRK